jgi:hypothetical protein
MCVGKDNWHKRCIAKELDKMSYENKTLYGLRVETHSPTVIRHPQSPQRCLGKRSTLTGAAGCSRPLDDLAGKARRLGFKRCLLLVHITSALDGQFVDPGWPLKAPFIIACKSTIDGSHRFFPDLPCPGYTNRQSHHNKSRGCHRAGSQLV